MKKITEITQPKQQSNQIRLAAYCRVSSDSTDQLHSFAAQIKYYSEYCKQHSEYKLTDIYADEGVTGTSIEKRDEFRRMLRDCKKGLIDRIIVKSMSSFARNTEEMLTALRALEEMGISVYFEEQGFDTESMNSEMFATFPGMLAQQESESISQNMRWSYKKRMESGEFNCCAPAYGFDLKNGKLVINETEAAVIRRIFDLYLQGEGMQSIANRLNAEGVSRRYGQKKWYNTTIRYMLNNERYMGDALLQKGITTQSLPHKKKPNRGEQPMFYVEYSNPAIISRETYEATQKLLKSREPKCKRNFKTRPLSKVLRCPDCGHSFCRQVINGTAYWTCSEKTRSKSDCIWRRVKEDEVYVTFNLMMRKLQLNCEYLIGQLIRQLEELQYRTVGSQQRIKEIDREIADLTAQNLVLSRLHGNGKQQRIADLQFHRRHQPAGKNTRERTVLQTMSNRNIPFGYTLENGVIFVNKSETETVKEIAQRYLDGDSLKAIAANLSERSIEYMPGKSDWNKSRIKRIVDDKRYIGDCGYPQILTERQYADMQNIKSKKYTKKDTNHSCGIFTDTSIVCYDCGGRMQRHYDKRRRSPIWWNCSECKVSVNIDDNILLNGITDLLNTVIAAPKRIQIPVNVREESQKIKQLNAEISKTLSTHNFDKESLKQKMLDCIREKYIGLGAETVKAQGLRDIFANASPLTAYNRKLADLTVSEVQLKVNGNISLILINGQKIEKERAK